jgi:hypothetical protein
VSFARGADSDSTWQDRLTREFGELMPWYELGRRRRGGRTLVGVAPQSPEINLQSLAAHLDSGELPTDINWLKRAIEDIRIYYIEAMTAQPGNYDSAAIHSQFWQESSFGAAILSLYRRFQNSDDDRLKMIARILAPREAVGSATGLEGGQTHA